METTLENKKKHITMPAGLMLVFCAIPVFILASFMDFGHNYMAVMQICFGYMWLWFLGIAVYWHHKKVFTTTWQYVLLVFALIFNGMFVVFLPYIFSDAFIDIFWK